jgi:hypothetical protein
VLLDDGQRKYIAKFSVSNDLYSVVKAAISLRALLPLHHFCLQEKKLLPSLTIR